MAARFLDCTAPKAPSDEGAGAQRLRERYIAPTRDDEDIVPYEPSADRTP